MYFSFSFYREMIRNSFFSLSLCLAVVAVNDREGRMEEVKKEIPVHHDDDDFEIVPITSSIPTSRHRREIDF